MQFNPSWSSGLHEEILFGPHNTEYNADLITYSPPTTTETTSDYSAFGAPTADATNDLRRQLASSSSEASTEPETITFTLDSPKVMSSFGILIPATATSFTLSSNVFEDIEATPGVMAIVDVQSSLQ